MSRQPHRRRALDTNRLEEGGTWSGEGKGSQLVAYFFQLPRSVGIDRHAAASVESQHIRTRRRSADGDVEGRVATGPDHSDGAAVDTAGNAFQVGDDLARAD